MLSHQGIHQEGITDRDGTIKGSTAAGAVITNNLLDIDYLRFFYHSGISVLNQPLVTVSLYFRLYFVVLSR